MESIIVSQLRDNYEGKGNYILPLPFLYIYTQGTLVNDVYFRRIPSLLYYKS